MRFLQKILELIKPLDLFLSALSYGLGLGVARYLGVSIDIVVAFLGGIFVVTILASAHLFAIYFRFPLEPFFNDETPQRQEDFRRFLLTFALVMLGFAGVQVVILQTASGLNVNAWLFIALYLLLALAYGIPPVRLYDRGFGEFALAILIGALAPAFAFSLQLGELHRLVTYLSFPLFLLALDYLLAFDFPDYAQDLKRGHGTLLIRLTWQRAIFLHNLLLAVAYLYLAVTPILGISFALIWPALLTVPLAAYQVFMLSRIVDGAKPVWPALTINAVAIFGVTVYLLTLTFWLR